MKFVRKDWEALGPVPVSIEEAEKWAKELIESGGKYILSGDTIVVNGDFQFYVAKLHTILTKQCDCDEKVQETTEKKTMQLSKTELELLFRAVRELREQVKIRAIGMEWCDNSDRCVEMLKKLEEIYGGEIPRVEMYPRNDY